jgi:GAF domain-containing protein/HAMP domain-containing protein
MSQSRPEQTRKISGKRNNSLSLQTRLVLFVLLVALVPLIIIATRDTLQTQQALINGAEISLRSNAEQTANSLDTFIQTTLDTIAGEANFSDFISYLTLSPSSPPIVQARALDILNTLRNKADIISYALVDINGNVLLDTVGFNVNNNESGEPYFLPVQFSDEPVVSYVIYEEDKTTSITFASAVKNINGAFIGILRAKYRSAVLQNVIIESVGPSDDISVLLLDPLSIRLADNQNPELVLKSITPLSPIDYSIAVNNHRLLDTSPEEQATNYPDFELALDNAVNQPFFRADISPDTPGDDTIAVAFLQTQPWTVAYSRPTSIFLADVQRQIRTNIILVLGTLVIIAMTTALIARSLTNPITALAKVADSISQGNFNARAKVSTTDEIGVLASAFNSMTERLSENLAHLEERVAERTEELQSSNETNARRASQFESIARVGRAISSTQTISELLPQITTAISEQFGFYHVGIFLLDSHREYAILVAANSEAGKKMLDRNHRLLVGGAGIVGFVTKTGQPRVALDVGLDAAFFNNPDLPDTHSEIALPLRISTEIIGALDVQSQETNAFSKEDVSILSILADQVSIAIQNARSNLQGREALAQADAASLQLSGKQWKRFFTEQPSEGFVFDGINAKDIKTSDQQFPDSLAIPLTVRGTRIGTLKLSASDPARKWTEDEIVMAQATAERTALAVESARLLQEAQKRAAKEQTIGDISAKIGGLVNIDNILQTAIQELGNNMPNIEIAIQFKQDQEAE